jgi:hypothetical protein
MMICEEIINPLMNNVHYEVRLSMHFAANTISLYFNLTTGLQKISSCLLIWIRKLQWKLNLHLIRKENSLQKNLAARRRIMGEGSKQRCRSRVSGKIVRLC